MKWRKTPNELVTFLSEKLEDVDCQMKKMLGYPAYLINGNMFIGTHQESLFIRLSREDVEKVKNRNAEVTPRATAFPRNKQNAAQICRGLPIEPVSCQGKEQERS